MPVEITTFRLSFLLFLRAKEREFIEKNKNTNAAKYYYLRTIGIYVFIIALFLSIFSIMKTDVIEMISILYYACSSWIVFSIICMLRIHYYYDQDFMKLLIRDNLE
jgi:Na+/H+ antiporter NhaD/arsenite permease-like protein